MRRAGLVRKSNHLLDVLHRMGEEVPDQVTIRQRLDVRLEQLTMMFELLSAEPESVA